MCARRDNTGLQADLTYNWFRGSSQDPSARERCRLHRRAGGGYWMTSELEQFHTPPFTHYMEIQTDADSRVEAVTVRLSGMLGDDPAGAVPRSATLRLENEAWYLTSQVGVDVQESRVQAEPGTQVEGYSALFAMLAVRRLRLAAGQASRESMLTLEEPSLEPLWIWHTCSHQGPDRITTPAGEYEAQRYIQSNRTHLWVDARGILLACQEGAPVQARVELVEYHWLGPD